MKKLSKSILSIILSAVILLGTVTAGGNGFLQVLDTFSIKASAATNGYTRESAASYMLNTILGKGWNVDGGGAGCDCKDLVLKYFNDVGGLSTFQMGNALIYANNAVLPSGWTRQYKSNGYSPQKGDVACWGTEFSKTGHVALVYDVDNTYIYVLEQDSNKNCPAYQNRYKITSPKCYIVPDFPLKHKINADLCTVSATDAYEGDRVYVLPASKVGYSFVRLDGVINVEYSSNGVCRLDGACSFVMPNYDVSVKAVYNKVSEDVTSKLKDKTVKIQSSCNGNFLSGGASNNSKTYAVTDINYASQYKVLVHPDGWASFWNETEHKFLTVQGANGSEYLGCYANDCQSWECFKVYKYGDEFYLLSQRTGRLMQLNQRAGGNNAIIPTDRYYDMNQLDGADWERFRMYGKDNSPILETNSVIQSCSFISSQSITSQSVQQNYEELFQSWIYSSFDYNGIVQSNKVFKALVVQDKYIIPQTVPFREGYSFVGWSTKANSNVAEYQPGDVVENSDRLVLYEVWNKTGTDMSLSDYTCEFDITKKTSEKIHLHADGEFSKKDITVSVISSDNSVAVGNTSEKVYKDELWHETLDTDITISAKNPGQTNLTVILSNSKNQTIAKSVINVDISATYTISYNVDGAVRTQTKKYKEDTTLLDFIPEKENNFFLGWSTTQGATKPTYGPGDVFSVNNNITLYPVWSKKEYVKIKSFSNGVLTLEGNGIMASYPAGKTPWKDYASSCTKIVIESGVSTIGSNAFADFVNLNTVVLPDNLISIGSKAFYNCGNLVNINAPSSLKKIGSSAFEGCSKLQNLPIPKGNGASDVSIGAYAFKSCKALVSLVIPSPVVSIGIGIFEGCVGLKSVEIPLSVKEIPETAFFGCNSLKNIELPDGLKTIDNGAFSGCTSISAIEIPDSVTEIGEQAFSGCSVLSEVEIPENVEYVGVSAFSNCSKLESVDIPDNIQNIGTGAFSGCSVLDNVKLPESIKVIPDGLFTNCSSLSNIEYSKEIDAIGNSAFLGCSSLSYLYWPETLTEIDDYAFFNCTSLGYVDLNEGLKRIGVCAFGNCKTISCIDIPASVDSIGYLAFMNCASLNTLNMQETEITIDDYAFSGCTSLLDVTLPEGTVVGEDIFSDCSSALKVNCYSTSAALQPIVDSGITTDTIYRVESVRLNKNQATVEGGKTLQLRASILPQNATNKKLYWISSNESIATVDKNGLVTGVSSGEVTIKAVADDGLVNCTCKINVNVPVTELTISNDSIESFVGNSFVLGCELMPEKPTNTAVIWSSSNPDIVSVDNDGVIELLKEGTATITATSSDGSFSDGCLVTSKKYVPISSLTLDKNSQELYVGDSFDLGVIVNPDNSTDSFYNWCFDTEETENIVSIDENNKVTALASGTVTVYASSGDIKSNGCVITVKSKAIVKSVSLGNDIELNYKSSAKLNPVIESDNGVKYKVEYKSSNANIATVDNNGNVYAAKKGNATITCTVTDEYGHKVSDACNISVNYAWWQWIIKIVLFGWIWY